MPSHDSGNLHEVSVEIGKLTAQVTTLTALVQALQTEVQGLTALKHRGAGVLLAVGVAASAIASFVTWLLGQQG